MMASSSVEPTFEGVKKTELVPGECGVELHQYAQVHTIKVDLLIILTLIIVQ